MGGDHPQQCSLLAPNPRALLLTTVVSGGHPLALRINRVQLWSPFPPHTNHITASKAPSALVRQRCPPARRPPPAPSAPGPSPRRLVSDRAGGPGGTCHRWRGPRAPPSRFLLLRKEGAPRDPPTRGPPAQHGDGDGACSPKSGRGPRAQLSALQSRDASQRAKSAGRRRAVPLRPRPRTRIRTPDPRRGSRARSPDPGPDLSRARPEHLPAPAAQSRAPARNKAGGGDAAPYLGERRVPRGDGRSKPGAEKRSSARAGRPPGSPPRPPQGPLEAARAIATAAPGRGSPGLSARPCGRQAGPPPRTPVRPRASPPAPAGPPNGGPTRRPLLRAFTRRRWGRRLES